MGEARTRLERFSRPGQIRSLARYGFLALSTREQKRVAVKVIDLRGNEVIRLLAIC